jgi:hypothetical protein
MLKKKIHFVFKLFHYHFIFAWLCQEKNRVIHLEFGTKFRLELRSNLCDALLDLAHEINGKTFG